MAKLVLGFFTEVEVFEFFVVLVQLARSSGFEFWSYV